HRGAPIPSLAIARPDVTGAVEAVFKRMVAKQPGDRQQSMTQVITELERCLREVGSSPPRGGSTEPTEDLKLAKFLADISAQAGNKSSEAVAQKAAPKTAAAEVTQDLSTGETSPDGLTALSAAMAAHSTSSSGRRHRVRSSWIAKHPITVLVAATLGGLALAI